MLMPCVYCRHTEVTTGQANKRKDFEFKSTDDKVSMFNPAFETLMVTRVYWW